MKPGRLISALQRAWLEEIGVDTHWLSTPPQAAAPAPARPARSTAAAGGASAAAPSPASPPLARAAVRSGPSRPAGPSPQAIVSAPAEPAHSVPGVSGYGAAAPCYLIVGAQPGIADEAAGHPFQGDSGRLLQSMLAAARLPHGESAHFTTLMKHRAPGGREPSADEVAAALPALRQEILTLRPQWILALGGVAAQALLGCTDDLAALRGGPHTWRDPDSPDIPVWVTFHPSSLLVRSADKAEAWRDLVGLARAVAASEAA